MHQEHINVVKFSNHSPSIFATSSFDQDVNLWDLRQKAYQPCYSATNSRGNVMVCFSPDDQYLLVSAVDNEQKLAQMLSRLTKIAEEFNVAVYKTNQVIADSGGGVFISDPKKPAGGHVLAHAATVRLMFRKGKEEQCVCKVFDAQNCPEAEALSFNSTENYSSSHLYNNRRDCRCKGLKGFNFCCYAGFFKQLGKINRLRIAKNKKEKTLDQVKKLVEGILKQDANRRQDCSSWWVSTQPLPKKIKFDRE